MESSLRNADVVREVPSDWSGKLSASELGVLAPFSICQWLVSRALPVHGLLGSGDMRSEVKVDRSYLF